MSPRRGALTALAVLVAFGAGAGATATAEADDAVQRIVLGGTGSDALVPMQVDGLYPGASAVTSRFRLQRGSGFDGGTFAVSVQDLRDYERGCHRPERNAGDLTCGDGPDQGELSQQLLLGTSWSDGPACASAALPLPGTALRDLAGVARLAPATLDGEDDVCLVLTLELPLSADDLVQSDQSVFDLRLGLVGATPTVPTASPTPTTGVGGGGGTVSPTPTPGATPGGGTAPDSTGTTPPTVTGSAVGGSGRTVPAALPFTGFGVLAAMTSALTAGALGLGLLRLTRRRPSPQTGP